MNITPISSSGKTNGAVVPFGMNYTDSTRKFIARFISTDTESDFFSNKDMIRRRIHNVLTIDPPEHSDNAMSITKDTKLRNVYEFSLDGFRQNYVLLNKSGFCYEKIQANITKFLECFDKFAKSRKNVSRAASMGEDEFRIS